MCKIEIKIKDNDVETIIDGKASVVKLLVAITHTLADLINDDNLVEKKDREDITKEVIRVLKSLVK